MYFAQIVSYLANGSLLTFSSCLGDAIRSAVLFIHLGASLLVDV